MKIAVIGIGTIGSQVIRHLAKEPGLEVHGFEMAYPGHPNAAAGGESRLFRSFEFGSPEYQQAVVERAPGAWRDLERETNRSLVTRTGALIFGDEDSRSLRELLENAKATGRNFETLHSEDLKRLHPQFRWKAHDVALWDPAGGIIRPELTVMTSAQLATQYGAKIHHGVRVDQIRDSGEEIELTVGGERINFDRAVVTSGGWTTQLIPDLRTNLVTRRLTSVWYQAQSENYVAKLPPFMRTAPGYCYGIPAADRRSVKVGLGFDDHLPVANPDQVSRRPDSEEVQKKFNWIVHDYLPGLHPQPVRIDTYIESYSTTMRDYIAFQGKNNRLLVMAGFSGKGFKIAPVLGEIGANAILSGDPQDLPRLIPIASPTVEVSDPILGITESLISE